MYGSIIRPASRLYSRKRPSGSFTRVVVEIPNDELEAVDTWGRQAAMPSRTSAIRDLLKAGIENKAKKASGSGLATSPDASNSNPDQGNHCDAAE